MRKAGFVFLFFFFFFFVFWFVVVWGFFFGPSLYIYTYLGVFLVWGVLVCLWGEGSLFGGCVFFCLGVVLRGFGFGVGGSFLFVFLRSSVVPPFKKLLPPPPFQI